MELLSVRNLASLGVLIFSFDSILSALAITEVFPVLALAIPISGVLMFVLADTVAVFVERNRRYDVLGLFILLIVDVIQSKYQNKLAARRKQSVEGVA